MIRIVTEKQLKEFLKQNKILCCEHGRQVKIEDGEQEIEAFIKHIKGEEDDTFKVLYW